MHTLKAGLILLLIFPTLLLGQVSGQVESMGFDNYVRPDCWIPMVVSLVPETSKTDTYQIHVKVQDMDRDVAIYSRTITVTGAAEGQTRQQKFRMYFVPPPVDEGLPDWATPNALSDLKDRVQVSLYDSKGATWICDLPLTSAVHNVDPKPGQFSQQRGTKLILAINDGRSVPLYKEPASDLLGVLEDVVFVAMRSRDLPEKVIGYNCIDGIVWLDADPGQLKAAGDEKFRALETYVRQGGRLVICQPMDWQKVLAFDDLLPVTVTGVEEKDDLYPLRAMATRPRQYDSVPNTDLLADPLAILRPPFRFARAVAKPNTVVSEWITWKTPEDISPYIVRMPLGLGAVTWVAQDLGDPALVRTRSGWTWVWDKVFDWNNVPLPASNRIPEAVKRPWEQGVFMDVGRSLISSRLDLTSKSAWLVTLAVLFFIGYWLLAGPGVYSYLAAKKRTHISWFAFGLCAFAATALTGLIVKLVLRGPPELRHFSIVRQAANAPAVVTSSFGLYIPRDGSQDIALKNPATGAATTIAPLPIHPYYLEGAPNQPGKEYYLPIVDEAAGQVARVAVPYRSTLKKFQASWVGDVEGAVQGTARLVDLPDYIAGNLTNGTGRRLVNVYFIFHYPTGGAANVADWMLYQPEWDAGTTLNLTRTFNERNEQGDRLLPGWIDDNRPDGRARVKGKLITDWQRFWLQGTGVGPLNDRLDDSDRGFPRSLAMMSVFDRLVPSQNERSPGAPASRIDILRRGGRNLDLSHAITAGQLVVLAEAKDCPIPLPLEVEGDKVTGTGSIFYQFVIPLDRSAVASTTQPAKEE